MEIFQYLKGLAKPKPYTIALFIGSVILLIAESFGYLEDVEIPSDMIWYLLATAVFTGSLLLIWFAAEFPILLNQTKKWLVKNAGEYFLSKEERLLLRIYAEEDTDSINIEAINHSKFGVSKLAFEQAANKLTSRGCSRTT